MSKDETPKDDTPKEETSKEETPKKEENLWDIKNIGDIIKLGESKIKENELDKNKKLLFNKIKKIIIPLKKMNQMVGMDNVKQVIVNQILFYIQDLHLISSKRKREEPKKTEPNKKRKVENSGTQTDNSIDIPNIIINNDLSLEDLFGPANNYYPNNRRNRRNRRNNNNRNNRNQHNNNRRNNMPPPFFHPSSNLLDILNIEPIHLNQKKKEEPPKEEKKEDNYIEDMMHTVIMGPPGCGKCLEPNTEIIMYNGSIKKAKDINEDDILMGDDSEPRHVKGCTTGSDTMYRIIPSDNSDEYIVNSCHLVSLMGPKLIQYVEEDNGVWNYVLLTPQGEKHLEFTNYDDVLKQLDEYTTDTTTIYFEEEANILNDRSEEWLNVYKGYRVGVEWNTSDKDDIKYWYIIGESYKTNMDKVKKGLLSTRKNRISLLRGILYNYELNKYFEDVNDTIDITNYKFIEKELEFLIRSLGLLLNKNDNLWNILYVKTNPNYNISIRKMCISKYYGFQLDSNGRFLLNDFTVTHNTEVSNIIAEIYVNLGLLKNKKIKFAKRSDLIGEYLGQTAIKTQKLLNECKGGCLVIDEAYSLGHKEKRDSFSKECVDTLNQFLSEEKHNFLCIIIGYEKDLLDSFFSINKGLIRRFPWKYKIQEYTDKELAKIFKVQCNKIHWNFKISDKELNEFFVKHKKLFKYSGGDIETVISKAKINHAKRIFMNTKDKKGEINLEDLEFAIKYLEEREGKDKEKDIIPSSLYM